MKSASVAATGRSCANVMRPTQTFFESLGQGLGPGPSHSGQLHLAFYAGFVSRRLRHIENERDESGA
jgi:hypothetical protein